jgi:hypothetical protein
MGFSRLFTLFLLALLLLQGAYKENDEELDWKSALLLVFRWIGTLLLIILLLAYGLSLPLHSRSHSTFFPSQ